LTSEENKKEAQRIREKIKGLNISEKKELTTNWNLEKAAKYAGYAGFDGNLSHCKGWKKQR
tara:strand:- start:262 stop:444 length:183 start_codon:yes stop_codon:yes gene_type:complete